MNQEPIFLMGAHKSGTSLLRSLFDGHSQLFVIPIEAHFFEHLGYWVDYSIRRRFDEELSLESIAQNLIKWIHKSNTTSDSYADNNMEGIWDGDEFEKSLYTNLEKKNIDLSELNGVKEIIQSYVHSMYLSLYGHELPDDLRVVEKSVENAEFALELKQAFPKAKFVHIIRNPYPNMVSIRKYRGNNQGFPFLKKIVYSLYNSFYYLEKNKRLIGKDYRVIKYEDLVQKPEELIKELVEFTGISDEEILYTPTALGKSWKGNSISDKKFNGISSDRLDQWRKSISPIEVNLINRWFKQDLKKYGYEQLKNKKAWAPVKGENIVEYLQNRLLLKFFM